MATKKAGGSTQNGRDSRPKYLGVKRYGSEWVGPGNIIIRQRGTKFYPGENVGMGKDHTLYALIEGFVRFKKRGGDFRRQKTYVYVMPMPPEEVPLPAEADTATQV